MKPERKRFPMKKEAECLTAFVLLITANINVEQKGWGTLSLSMLNQIIDLINDSSFEAQAKLTAALKYFPHHYIKMETFKWCREKALS